MNIRELRKNWEAFGEKDPLWAILTAPDKAGGGWDVAAFFKTGEEEIDRLMSRIRSLGCAGSRRKALDFGCGVGRLTQALAGHYEEAVGVDIAASMIQKAREYDRRNNCKYYCNTDPDLRMFSDNAFDLVYTNLVLQHMKPVYSKKYIVEFLRTLKTGGLLVFQLPNGRKRRGGPLFDALRNLVPEAAIDGLFHARIRFRARTSNTPLMEMYYVSKKEIVNLCETHGGVVLDIRDESPTESVWTSSTYFVKKNNSPAH